MGLTSSSDRSDFEARDLRGPSVLLEVMGLDSPDRSLSLPWTPPGPMPRAEDRLRAL